MIDIVHSIFYSFLKIPRQNLSFGNNYCNIFQKFCRSFNIFGLNFDKTNFSILTCELKLECRMFNKFLGTAIVILMTLPVFGQENRTFSGEGNNFKNRDWGAAHSQVLRVTRTNYADNISAVNDAQLPIPRKISNELFEQKDPIFDSHLLSDFVWVFGQFIDHDITLVESDNTEPVILDIPIDDEYFTPSDFIFTSRNKEMTGTGLSVDNPREYINEISSFLDGSAVYGSDKERADWLRSFTDGKLKVSEGDLLPWNTVSGEFSDDIDTNSPFMADDTRQLSKWFVAGDIRANENPLLVAMHTIFVREHNRLCDELKENHPNWDDERLYQRARKLVGAYMQNILFYEWLPSLGVILPEYSSYNEDINPSVTNVFSAAAFRIGHTMINSDLLRMDNNGDEIPEGNIKLQDAFFNPQSIILAGGVDPFFKGMGIQVMQELDCKVIGDLRNFLFGAPGSGGLDLASLNIFRGRDRGLASYNQIREDFGLPLVKDFSDFTASEEDAVAMENLYGTPDNLDAWVGMLAEQHIDNAVIGPLVMRIMEDQFQNLRDGDRFYFENDPAFTLREKNEIKNIKLYDILMRNTKLSIMQRDLFFAMPHSDIPNGPDLSPEPLAAALYPNPAFDQTTIKINAVEDQLVNIKIFNPNGQLIKDIPTDLIQGENFIDLPLQTYWPRGLYNVYIEAGEQFSILRLIKE